jgi:DNA-binding NtrC family response regulator
MQEAVLRTDLRAAPTQRDDPALEVETDFPGFVTSDAGLRAVLALLERAAPTCIPILLQGESGTGKEVAARAVHALSARARGPFVALNCGAISAELAEAELFGHERGAFTGAVGSSPGAFGAADGGTLFLDEVGDLPLNLQVKLLRALECSEVKPVGAARARTIDVRIVSASHRDLRALVRDGGFREDLFFRLRGLAVELPALCDRPHDVLPLAEHFLAAEPGGESYRLAADARLALQAQVWTGNARELRHAVRLGMALCRDRVVRAFDLRLEEPLYGRSPPRDRGPRCEDAKIESRPASAFESVPESVSLRGRTLDELESIAIRAAWHRHGGARRSICAELGIARSSLLRKLSALGLRPSAADASDALEPAELADRAGGAGGPDDGRA